MKGIQTEKADGQSRSVKRGLPDATQKIVNKLGLVERLNQPRAQCADD